nr:hypothetical protein [Myxococcales bacterium]
LLPWTYWHCWPLHQRDLTCSASSSARTIHRMYRQKISCRTCRTREEGRADRRDPQRGSAGPESSVKVGGPGAQEARGQSHRAQEGDRQPGLRVGADAIQDRNRELKQIEGRIEAARAAPSVVDLETRRMEQEARKRLEDLRSLLRRRPEDARVAIEALLEEPLTFTAEGEKGQGEVPH